MIAKITGILDEIGSSWVIVDAMGVGYQLHCSTRTLSRVGERGHSISLRVAMAFKQDHVILYGFSSVGERVCFDLLQTVQGVGGKVALGILSLLSPDDIVGALERKDPAPFGRADGVGPKLAQRIVNELGGKRDVWEKMMPLGAPSSLPPSTLDATSALMNLGYRHPEIESALSQLDPATPLDLLLTQALQILGQKAS